MSTNRLKVGVKFCGHCNPQKDGSELVEKLKLRLPEIEFVSWHQVGYDVLLVVSACPVDCVSKPDFEGPQIKVACNEVREWNMPPDHPAKHLVQACLDEGLSKI